ncbi:hypothetical protein CYMTET_22688 [Cymbomonas tetramitiformis]|uniref:Uncharacterized protein n=1 Tax=Cymbomonas tetramitiformis TaxID=36881 RepID=A0AAE0FZD9_9CHLO|nr:hypothetical protein CYMTET_22688 [Cymbomonas tetramitiformis]
MLEFLSPLTETTMLPLALVAWLFVTNIALLFVLRKLYAVEHILSLVIRVTCKRLLVPLEREQIRLSLTSGRLLKKFLRSTVSRIPSLIQFRILYHYLAFYGGKIVLKGLKLLPSAGASLPTPLLCNSGGVNSVEFFIPWWRLHRCVLSCKVHGLKVTFVPRQLPKYVDPEMAAQKLAKSLKAMRKVKMRRFESLLWGSEQQGASSAAGCLMRPVASAPGRQMRF